MTNRELPQELDVFLKTFADNLSKAIQSNILPSKWFCSNFGNRESLLHSRVLAILGKSGFDLEYVVEVAPGFKPQPAKGVKPDRQFKPDIQLCKKDRHSLQPESDIHSFLIEYESTNSSDLRILRKDLTHFKQSQNNEPFPDYWLVIYTLPNKPVTEWTLWDFHSKFDPRAVEMKVNPHRYYKKLFEDPSGFDSCLPNIVDYTAAYSD